MVDDLAARIVGITIIALTALVCLAAWWMSRR